MGIIISAIPGMGQRTLIEEHGKDVKFLDLTHFTKDNKNELLNELDAKTEENDIIFVSSDADIVDFLCDEGINFDFFYIPPTRKVEFLMSFARNRADFGLVRDFDNNFQQNYNRYESLVDEHIHKHRMDEKGTFIGDYDPIKLYIEQCTRKNQE